MLTVSCSLRAKCPNKDKDGSEVTGRVTAKPVKHRRKKKKSPSALARSRDRHRRFLQKKLAGKSDLASPEDKRISTISTREQDSDNSLCATELKYTFPKSCGSSGDPVSLETPTPARASDPDLVNEQATLLEYLDTQSIDSDGVVSSDSVCADCGRPPKKRQDPYVARTIIYPSTAAFSARRLLGLFRCGQEVGNCLDSLPQGPVHSVLKLVYKNIFNIIVFRL